MDELEITVFDEIKDYKEKTFGVKEKIDFPYEVVD